MNATPTAELRGGTHRLLTARSIAVVGASDKRGPQRATIDNLVATGARAWGVHPRRDEVRGLRCAPSVADLPEVPDVAMLLVGHAAILEAAADAVAAGVGALVVPGLGPEAGADALPVAARLARMAEEAGVPVLGTNCMGVVVPDGLSAWVGTLGDGLRGGRVAAVVQSGSVGEALCALGPRAGFRCIVSVGTELTRDIADWCAELAADDETEAVALFLETVRRPAALRRALELLDRAGKPVACLRVGKSDAGARATIAHTDAVLTPARSFAALARAANLIEVDDFSELVEAVELLGRRRRPSGPRIAAVTQSGGEAALIGDLADAAGAPLPDFSPALTAELAAHLPAGVTVQNPLDAWTIDDTEAVYRRVFEAIARSREYDALVVQLDQSPFVGELERGVAERVATQLAAVGDEERLVPVLLSINASEPTDALRRVAADGDIALLRGSGAAVRALVRVAGWSPGRGTPPPDPTAAVELGERDLGEVEAAALLRAHGVRFAPHRRAVTEAQAVAAARLLGHPVVVKADEPGHRSAGGRVVLGLTSDDEVRAAFRRVGRPAIVARQLPPAPELYCGGQAEGDYGPILCVGWGGRHVERSPGVACALAPVDETTAGQLLADVPGVAEACGDELLGDLCATVVAIGRLVAGLPRGASVDVNPILLSEQHGAVAVDALVATPGA